MSVTPRLVGLIATAAALAAVILAFHPPVWPWQPELQFSLAAQPFGQLDSNATVELGGVRVGQVEGLDLENGRYVVHVEVAQRYAGMLHANTSATIQALGLLGPNYVSLQGGDRGRLQQGAVIPSNRVHAGVAVDQVLDSLGPTEQQSLQVIITELGIASDDRGSDINSSLKALGAASGNVKQVTATLQEHNGDLQSIISNAQTLSASLQYAPLDKQIKDTDTVLSGLTQPQVNAAIGDSLDHTNDVLDEIDVILDGNTQNLSYTLKNAPQTVLQLRTLLAEGTSLVNGVNPSLPALMTAIVETQSAFGGHDANGNYVRIMVVPGACTVGLNLGCAGGPGSGGPPVTVPDSSSPGYATPPAASQESDQDLMRLLLGS
ncbi:MAG TPA: MlaD family protein [Candidatus Dormibacteraeota bacterium]|jgi:ABC-type transporter Mla subunit MlaD|nr:MlaD family protein [Candidatus Dormibacteraeota bacterium]